MPKKLKNQKTKKSAIKKAKVAVKKPAKKIAKKVVKKVAKKAIKSVPTNSQSLEQLFDAFFTNQVEVKAEKEKQESKNNKSLDELFDELFSDAPAGDSGKDLEDVYKDVEPTPKKVLTLEELFADVSPTQPVKTTSIFNSVVTPKTQEEDLAEIELSALTSSKTLFKKAFGILGVSLAALLIGILWLQVTYGYFTEMDNSSKGDQSLNEIINKNSESFNIIKSDIEETYNSAVEQYQKLKNK